MGEHNPTALSEGAVFHGRYQITRCLKAGGMGAIYECVHLTTRKHRALKVMLPELIASPGMRARFELEARVTAEIESDHIVETFDAGVDEATGAPFLVMELLRGDDLDGLLESRGPFTAEETVGLLSQVAPALDRTHAAGIVHRDLKPQNLFLTTRDDGSPRLKILDFGIAKMVADGTKTAQQTAAIGTPVYMAPEQATGDGTIGAPADLYALAHIAYTLLVGNAYWMEEYAALPILGFLNKMVAGKGEPPSTRAARGGVTLPVAFDAWFARATAGAPGERFDRASTQIAELATALGVLAPQSLLGLLPLGRMSSQAAIATPQVPFQASGRTPVGSQVSGGVAAASRMPAQPLAVSSSGGTTSPLLNRVVPVAQDRRSAGPFVAGALLLFAVGIGVTVVVTPRSRGNAPAVTGAPAMPPADVQTAMASAVPVLPTGTVEAVTAAPSAAAPPKARGTPTARPTAPVKPLATSRSAATAAPVDPTRNR